MTSRGLAGESFSELAFDSSCAALGPESVGHFATPFIYHADDIHNAILAVRAYSQVRCITLLLLDIVHGRYIGRAVQCRAAAMFSAKATQFGQTFGGQGWAVSDIKEYCIAGGMTF